MKTYIAPFTAMVALAVSLAHVSAADTTGSAQLSYGVSDVLKLSQAKVSDDTIVSYVQNSGRSYTDLNATEIVYLHQQGVSDKVVNSMLEQRKNVTTSGPTTQADAYASQAQQPQAAVAAPAVTYVQQPASTVYVIRDSSPRLVDYGYYPRYPYYGGYYYGWSPRISVSFSGGYRGGYRGNSWGHGSSHGGGGGWGHGGHGGHH